MFARIFLWNAKNGRKGPCPQNTRINAEKKKNLRLRFCVILRVLRANPDSVAALLRWVFCAFLRQYMFLPPVFAVSCLQAGSL
jgi:hypothetical protein